jgi:protein PhnA
MSLYAMPEPGPCPECSDDNAYWDGSTNFVCTACGHEWPVDTATNDDEEEADDDGIIRDSNGNILETGDTVVLTKELGKGLKKGLKVTRIRLGDFGDGHDVEASIPGLGTFLLKSQFLKKAGK